MSRERGDARRRALPVAITLILVFGGGLAVGGILTLAMAERDALPERGEVRQRVEERVKEVVADVELLRKLDQEGYEANPLTLRKIQTGGQPDGRWNEGLTFEGVAPMPWLKSAA